MRRPPRSTEERLVRAQKSMTPGTLGGRVASAAPMSLDVTRLDPRLRAQKRPTGGGFDPNADPVRIGLSAVATGAQSVAVGKGATASTYPNATAVGAFATATAAYTVALGRSSSATFQYAVAIGYSAHAAGINAVSIGANSYGGGAMSTAVGYGTYAAVQGCAAVGQYASANGTYSAAFGYVAYVDPSHAHSTALGPDATTTKSNQVMIGSTGDFAEIAGSGVVLKDTATGTRYLVQITSGAIVLNTAP